MDIICLNVLFITNSVALNTGEHVFFQITVFSVYMSKNVTAGWHGSSVFCL